MARINIEADLFTDRRWISLCIEAGDYFLALGWLTAAWQLAWRYWVPDKRLIPLEKWQGDNMPDALFKCRLAEMRGDFVYVKGVERRFNWWFEGIEQRKLAGRKSAEARKRKNGSAQPEGGRQGKKCSSSRTKEGSNRTESEKTPRKNAVSKKLSNEKSEKAQCSIERSSNGRSKKIERASNGRSISSSNGNRTGVRTESNEIEPSSSSSSSKELCISTKYIGADRDATASHTSKKNVPSLDEKPDTTNGVSNAVARTTSGVKAKRVSTKKGVSVQAGKDCQAFVAAYCEAFARRYGPRARPDLSGAVRGQIMRFLAETPLDKASSLIQVYCQMRDRWFETKCHDFETFRQNITKVQVSMANGKEPNRKDADAAEIFAGWDDGKGEFQ